MSGAEALAVLYVSPAPCVIMYGMTGAEDGSGEFRAAQLADPTFAAIPIIMWAAPESATASPDTEFVRALLALVGRHCEHADYAS